jgi:NTE family protein
MTVMKRVLLPCVLVASTVGGAAEPTDRPRVGLVLSGGGALGAAHIGVLKVLEELRVPIDCVAGTSIGAIVGGIYAAGYTPQEIEDVVLAIRWSDLLDDRPDRRRVPYRRKQDDLTFLTRLEVGFNRGKFQLPSALVEGQKLNFLLQALTIHTVGLSSFDDLPVPFRTIATDLETGDEVVLDRGDLAHAIRASMAVPGVFSPVEIGGRLLVDGGLVNNLPVDQGRAMGADVVIAVDVGEPLRTRKRLTSLADVTRQVLRMVVVRSVARQKPDADLVIHPAVDEFTTSDFNKASKMIALGEQAAREAAEGLQRFSVSETEYAKFRERFQQREFVEPTVASVQVTSESRTDPRLVLREVRTRPGDPLDLHAIARDLERLYAIGDYELVSFSLAREQGGYGLHILANDKSWGPHTMRFGVNLFSDFAGNGRFNLLADYTMTRLNPLRGEAKFALQIGEEPRVFAEFYQPFDVFGRFFFAPYVEYGERFSADFKPETILGGVDLGISLGRYGEIRAGAVRGSGKAHMTGTEAVPAVDFDWGGLSVRAVIDQIDNPNVPRRGFLGNISLLASREDFGSDSDFDRLTWSLLGAGSRGRHTVLGWLKGGSTLGSETDPWWWSSIGGLFNLSGYPPGYASGPDSHVGVLSYFNRVVDFDSRLCEAIYGGVSAEAGNVWAADSNVSLGDLLISGSLFVAMDTYFGPIYLAYGHAEGGNGTWYLFLGRTF